MESTSFMRVDEVAQELGISTYTPKAGEDWSHLFRKK